MAKIIIRAITGSFEGQGHTRSYIFQALHLLLGLVRTGINVSNLGFLCFNLLIALKPLVIGEEKVGIGRAIIHGSHRR